MWTFVDVIRYEAILSIPPEGTIHLDLDVGGKKKKKKERSLWRSAVCVMIQ